MLYCYNVQPSEGGSLVRAMPLEGAVIIETSASQAKYKYMFEVHNLNFLFRMRASSEEERTKWIQVLQEERDSHSLYHHQLGSVQKTGAISKAHGTFEADGVHVKTNEDSQFIQDLSPVQKLRYDFFKNERDFVRNLTNIAEELRFKEPQQRKALVSGLVTNLNIPSCVYVPLCNSSDIWRRVHTPIAKETRVFNTNERCPVVMNFVTRRGEKVQHRYSGLSEANLDVAEYLHLLYEVPDSTMSSILEEEKHSSADDGTNDENIKDRKPSEGNLALLWKDEEDDFYNGMESERDIQTSEHQPKKTNALLKIFMKDNFNNVPQKIRARLPHRQKSLLSRLPVSDVRILENRLPDDEDERSVVSDANSGSILLSDGAIMTQQEHDGIDEDSIQRATDFICKGENWTSKTERMLREAHDDDHFDNEGISEVTGVMIKSNDDLRQEVFVMQMIHFYKSVFAKASLPIWLKTYRILSTSKDTGMIEYLKDTTSIDGLKKSEKYPKEGGLQKYFENIYGDPDSRSFKAAQRNFMLSLVGYSLVAYLLGLKDRHNGNIMIDVRGRLIFIDFGFAMGMAPGHEFSFERAPFKLTQDYIDVMGGTNSACFAEFKRLFVAGFEAARANSQIALGLVEIMMYKSNYPCFSGPRYGGNRALVEFQRRLMLTVPEKDVRKKALRLISKSINHKGTWAYDRFQQFSCGYAM
jgi:phosphatidylinositol 4-kinase